MPSAYGKLESIISMGGKLGGLEGLLEVVKNSVRVFSCYHPLYDGARSAD